MFHDLKDYKDLIGTKRVTTKQKIIISIVIIIITTIIIIYECK
jgi:hypothetical protein